jgi:hypothetical protein
MVIPLWDTLENWISFISFSEAGPCTQKAIQSFFDVGSSDAEEVKSAR